MTPNQELFVEWMQTYQPRLYKAAINKVGIGAADQQSWWQSFVGAAKELVPIIVGARSQKKILNVQMTRAEQGLAPLNVEQLSPTVRVQAGLTPQMKQILIPSLLGIGALVLFMVLRKK